jgi:predicted SprT family Zn-dependent metalloprotease
MNTETARRTAEKVMKKHGLIQKGWVFEWDDARHRFGQCNYKIKVLSFSKFLTQNSEEGEFMDTVMHEIAHALVGPGHGHKLVWKNKMIELGQVPNRCGTFSAAQKEAIKEVARYVCTCPVTGMITSHKHRKRNPRLCKCHGESVLWNGMPFEMA